MKNKYINTDMILNNPKARRSYQRNPTSENLVPVDEYETQYEICRTSQEKIEVNERVDKSFRTSKNFEYLKAHHCCMFTIIVVIPVIIVIFFNTVWLTEQDKINVKNELKGLSGKYGKQDKALWASILKMVSEDNVHSLTLLYQDNESTAECIVQDVIKIINKIHGLGNDRTIYTIKNEDEYGSDLVYFRGKIERTRHIFVPNIQNVPASKAMIFHFLCDDTAPRAVHPSYCIFTLKDTYINSQTAKSISSIQKAGNILRSIWRNLQENELNPLLSRVVRNVVRIVPETVGC